MNTEQDFKELSAKTNIDLVFYGSSHTFTAYNPLIFNKICETISFNLGSDAQRIFVTDLVLEESLKHTSPKLVVLEVYIATLNAPKADDIKGFQLRALDFVSNFSPSKLKRVQELYDSNEYLGVVSPLIRNHKKWDKISLSDLYRRERFDKNWAFYYGGFLGSDRIMENIKAKNYENFATQEINKTAKKKDIDPKALAYLENFINIAKNNGAEVLIVSSPDVRARSYYYPFFDQVAAFCEKKEVEFLNLNNHYLEMELTTRDFKDPSHLNNTGAIKASTFLANHISNNYDLPDRKKDEIWNRINKKYFDFENSYIHYSKEEYQTIESLELFDQIAIKELKIVKRGYGLDISIQLDSNKFYDELINSYNLLIKAIPEVNEQYLLSDRSKKFGWDYDKVDIVLDSSTRTIETRIPSKVHNIKAVEMFLYNRKNYDGPVGNKILINTKDFEPSN